MRPAGYILYLKLFTRFLCTLTEKYEKLGIVRDYITQAMAF